MRLPEQEATKVQIVLPYLDSVLARARKPDRAINAAVLNPVNNPVHGSSHRPGGVLSFGLVAIPVEIRTATHRKG
jgi:hypothetical protein